MVKLFLLTLEEVMTDELWVDVVLYDKDGGIVDGISDKYNVSSFGRVKNKHTGKFVSPVLTGKPQYWYVNLTPSNGDKRLLRRVHNIQACSFYGEALTSKHTADHIDQNRFNNSLYNIRWADKRAQSNNRYNTLFEGDGETPLTEYLERLGYSKESTLGTYVYNRMATHKESFTDAIFSYANYITPTYNIKVRKYPKSLEVNGVWYPSKKSLVGSVGNCKLDTFNTRLSKGIGIEGALNFNSDKRDTYRFYMDGFYGTRKEHCNHLSISYERIKAIMHKEGIPFEQAYLYPVKRVDKHCINGIIKKNFEWFDDFNIKPKTANGYMNRGGTDRNIRDTLEYYGVDTSEMEIYPCDGNVIMKNQPI